MDGILNIYKPSGMTSHDVVERVRKIMKERRVGHTGTLDPLATGVLVLCIGKATRIAQYLEAGEKEYRAVMRLGITTDTLDAEGSVLETKSYVKPGQDEVLDAMKGFTGRIMQQPPAYSALKISGVPSYKLAREGRAIPHKLRSVDIFTIDLVSYEDPVIALFVRCSKGVYIRTLCADLGSKLGMGAHLTELERTRSGNFTAKNAIGFDQLMTIVSEGAVESVLTPIDEALNGFPLVSVSDSDAMRVLHGNMIACERALADTIGIVRLHNPAGKLLALAQHAAGSLRPTLVFPTQT